MIIIITTFSSAREKSAAPMSNNATDLDELNVCCTELKLPYRTDSDAALLSDLIHQLGSAHEPWRLASEPGLRPRKRKSRSNLSVLIKMAAGERREEKKISFSNAVVFLSEKSPIQSDRPPVGFPPFQFRVLSNGKMPETNRRDL